MKSPLTFGLFALVLGLLTACSTVGSRISRHRDSFATWPPHVQQAVSAGQIGVGFTAEQVRVALGDPHDLFSRRATTGDFEVWSYRDRGPRFGFGIGIGGGSYHHGRGYSTGVSVATGAGHPDERLRVVFDQTGRVSSIEEIRRGR